MPPFHALSFALRIIVMHPCLLAGDNSFQDTRIFFIPSKGQGRNLHALSLVHNSKLLGNPPCADFAVSQIIMQMAHADPMLISKCAATSDTVICLSSLIMALTLSMWSRVRNVDGRPERPSSATRVRPDLNLSTNS